MAEGILSRGHELNYSKGLTRRAFLERKRMYFNGGWIHRRFLLWLKSFVSLWQHFMSDCFEPARSGQQVYMIQNVLALLLVSVYL